MRGMASNTPDINEYPKVVPRPYPSVRNLVTVGLLGSCICATYYWTLYRMNAGNEQLMEGLDDADGGYSSAGKEMAAKTVAPAAKV